MPFTIPEITPSGPCQYSRIALALGHAAVDAETQPSIVAYRWSVQDRAVSTDYFGDLVKNCARAWDEYMDHPFPKQLASDTVNLDGFRHYMVQDLLYLEHYYRLRTEAVSKTGTLDDIKKVATKLAKSLDWVTSFRDGLTTRLGIPASTVAREEPSKTLLKSIALHKEVNEKGDWLDIHIVLSPCILGYDTIASNLFYDPQTVRNSIYYPLWIQANVGGSSVKEYKRFINDSIRSLPETERKKRWPIWVDYFTRACEAEKAFFDLANLRKAVVPLYKVVKNDIYKVRSYRNGYSLVGRPDRSVETSAKPTEGAWELTKTQEGYVFRSVAGQTGFLSASIDDLTQPTYQVKLTPTDLNQRWSINTFTIYNEQGAQQVFQIYLPGKTKYVLDAGESANNAKVFATNNSLASHQLWMIDRLGV